EHREAVEKDLLIKTGHSLDDIGRSLSWGALGAFLRHLDPDSETALELEPDLVKWAGRMKTNALLADIYDMLAMINANICAMGTGKKATKPKKYPRPNDSEKKTIGKKGLPPEELRAWFDKKRKERQKRLEE
ncbi:MAG: hypothetical protein J6Y26_05585, partial [Lachnospiraceae bacterium]|nr:hypothetical protein [Lachnospiraceae bacterium]